MNGKNESQAKNENQKLHSSHDSHHSHSVPVALRPVIPPRGGYPTLLSFQKAEVVYDITFRFANRFLSNDLVYSSR